MAVLADGTASARRLARRATRLFLDALLPPRCLACGELIDEAGSLCVRCWDGVRFLGPPCCAACGHPFEYAMPEGTLCGACVRRRPAYERARAVFRYDEASRALVLGFKHGDRTEAAPAYARWLARAGAELVPEAALIVPVPLHRWRLFRRRYNQSALLALALGRATRREVVPDLLVRRRNTPSQGRLDPAARVRNVRGAFALRPSAAEAIGDRRVLLVDDVMTTGATVEECARVLRRGGAAAVDVLTLARVVRSDP
jgi:ComF family protein